MNRKYFNWMVTLQTSAGEVIEKRIKVFWTPDKEWSEAYVVNCATAMVRKERGSTEIIPVGATRL